MATRSYPAVWPAVKPVFITAMVLFVFTVVVGILNGLDIYKPDHDTLITHVHAGTLGWITLSVSGAAMLIFTQGGDFSESDLTSARRLAWSMTVAIALYVLAFFAGDRVPGDRIQRPVFGTLLFIVVVWFGVWLFQQNRAKDESSVVRLGVLLAWASLMIGAVLGVILGIFSARGEVPGLSDDTASRLAESHPPSMVIGFLILAGAAITEWLIRNPRPMRDDKWGVAQMWMIFVSGVVIIFALAMDNEDLLGPANLLEIVAVGILVVRLRKALLTSGWRGAGTSVYGRFSIVFLVANLVVLTVLVSQVVSGAMDFDALTEAQLGLILTLDHLMFVGVMTMALFGVMAKVTHPGPLALADKILLWGVTLGIIGFAAGLLTVTPALKRISTPVLGIALLIGIAFYIKEILATPSTTP
jgi:hypothetical protein